MGRLMAVLAACLLLAGCSDWPPYAVRTGPHGGVEIVYANCDTEIEKLVPYRQPDPKQEVHVQIAYEDRPLAADQWFTLDQLGDGKTLYRWDWVSAEAFDKRCE